MKIRLFILCLACTATGTAITSLVAFPWQAPFWLLMFLVSGAMTFVGAVMILGYHRRLVARTDGSRKIPVFTPDELGRHHSEAELTAAVKARNEQQ